MKATDQLMLDECKRVVRLLDAAGVHCVIIGGLAMRELGFPEQPDIDISIDYKSIDAATQILGSEGYARTDPQRHSHFERDGIPIDLLPQGTRFYTPEGVYDSRALPCAEHPSNYGSRGGFATPAGLIRSKHYLRDEKHVNDVRDLKAKFPDAQ